MSLDILGDINDGYAVIAAVVLAYLTWRYSRRATDIPNVARCTVQFCDTTGTLANPGGNWHRDREGRHFCPAHPPATSCRICGRNKDGNRLLCTACARGEG